MRALIACLLLVPALAGCTGPGAGVGLDPVPPYPVPDFTGIASWINSPALDWDDLEGKVVIVDFWTYSCINCIRTLPHVTSWYDTYADYGLVVVGVHSPEFDFEKDRQNVEEAIEQYSIHYPVAQDNDHATWRAFNNHYWPAKYIVDATGIVRYTHFGEGDYLETETTLRDLLQEAGATSLPARIEGPEGTGARGDDVTGEIYAGYGRDDWRLANKPSDYAKGASREYSTDGSGLVRDRIYLDGTWTHTSESVHADSAGSLWLRFRAGASNIVADGAGCLQVYLDDAPVPADRAGADVDLSGTTPCIWLDGPRSYDVYSGPVETHKLELRGPAGFELYTFAFSAYDQV